MSKETWFCAECGSENIHHDSTSVWNSETEAFETVGVQDTCWCNDCTEGDPTFGIPGGGDE